jgi:hypothetical protein
MTTPAALQGDFNGLWIGGGESKVHNLSWGVVNMYSGLISVPRIAIYNGVINLYGGTLEGLHDVNVNRPDFFIGSTLFGSPVPINMINISGGTLRLYGDWTAQIDANIADGKIIAYNNRAASYPAYDYGVTTPGFTTVTGIGDFGAAWQPNPTTGQIELPMTPATPLTWTPGDYVNTVRNQPGDSNGHRVYFGTSFNDVSTAVPGLVTATSVYRGAFDTNIYDINGDVNSRYGPLAFNTMYYWRVDEVNVGNPNSPWKGGVWHFTTSSGRAYAPYPPDDSNIGFDINTTYKDSYMRWTKGLLTQSTNGHRVYFGTSFNEVNDATTSTPVIYRGVRTDANYPISYLWPDHNLAPDYTLVPEANYYWRVDEVNAVHEPNTLKGYVWRMIFPNNYIVENFSRYATSDDLNAIWKTNFLTGMCSGGGYMGPGATLTLDASAQTMILDYNNTGLIWDCFSEGRYNYPAAGVDWTAPNVPSGPIKLLHVSYKGLANNDADPCFDRMYVKIADANTKPRFGPVCYNPDPLAQRTTSWTDWYIKLTDLNSPNPYPVDLKHIRYLFLGMGLRCNIYGSANPGGHGQVTFDNIWVTQPICNPRYGPVADFSDDCFVDIADLDLFSTDWLLADTTLSYPDACAPSVAPVLWYNFDETDGNIAHNTGSGGSTYDANVVNRDANTWDANGHIGRCINLTYGKNSCVNIPPAALAPFAPGGPNTPGLTFTVWINLDVNNAITNWNGLIDANGGNSEVIEIEIPTYQTPQGARARIAASDLTASNRRQGDFGGRWNHYAIVKDADANIMRIYENGARIAEINNANIDTPLLTVVPTLFRVGSRTGDNWGMWAGKIDDFRMYDYALNADQVAWIATNGTGSLYVPLAEPTNLKRGSSPERVDFSDFAVFANQWLTEQLWP